jgi:YfiR/HmsC-like
MPAILAASVALRLGAGNVIEDKVKSAFVYNFAKFVEWPAGTFSKTDDPLTVCTLGDGVLGGTLDEVLKDKTVNDRPVVTRHLKSAAAAKGCHVLFIGVHENRQLADTLAALHDMSILTVGESADFSKEGGMISLVMESNRVRFRINLPVAERAGLKVSSRLLGLALAVDR